MSLVSPGEYREHDPGCPLGDPAIQRIIDANEAFVDRVVGPATTTTEIHEGTGKIVSPFQEIGSISSISESDDGSTWTILSGDDYLVVDGSIVRLANGSHARAGWGELVSVTYVPRVTVEERKMAIVELVALDVYGATSGAFASRTIGTWTETFVPGDRTASKMAIVRRLARNRGVAIR